MNLDHSGNTDLTSLELNRQSKDFLLETTKWTTLLLWVVGVIGVIYTIAAIYLFLMTSNSGGDFAFLQDMVMLGVVFFFVYIAVLLIPVYYLYQFTKNAKDAVNYTKEGSFKEGIRNLKSTFKFLFIFVIISIVLSIVLTYFVTV